MYQILDIEITSAENQVNNCLKYTDLALIHKSMVAMVIYANKLMDAIRCMTYILVTVQSPLTHK